MAVGTTLTMKKLTKIKLVNWHYFSNETISVNGSFLISGENATGKSTILDAIQLVLTTNTRRFNPAANEKSKRDLKGYVRCKTGEEGNTYYRTGSVISYIALEFYEESKDQFFVLGVKLDSPDLDSEIKRKWFREEGTLDSLSFIVDNKPALDEQFKNNGKRVTFIQQTSEAKSIFKRRLGNLDDTFFDMIPKSLAFKPMDNIKSFINKFILPEKQIDVDMLRENIRNLREMQRVMEKVKQQIEQLGAILEKYDEIKDTDKDILVIDILIKIAEIEAIKENQAKTEDSLAETEVNLKAQSATLAAEKSELDLQEDRLREIEIAIRNNECSQMIEKLKNDLALLEEKKKPIEEKLRVLKQQIGLAVTAVKTVPNASDALTAKVISDLDSVTVPTSERIATAGLLDKTLNEERDRLYREDADIKNQVQSVSKDLSRLGEEINALKRNRLIYPENTVRLKKAIEEEFENRKISSEVRIFADLLEIIDPKWQNAVESYLNTQRFHILVEPQYYDIAAKVYDRMKSQIHSAALVNTQALKMDAEAPEDSLAAMIQCENRYAKAYAMYLMGRVVRCTAVEELKGYPIAITDGCMLYQSKALRKIDENIYRIPYIGKYALKRQLELKQEEYTALEEKKCKLSEQKAQINKMLGTLNQCNTALIIDNISSPDSFADIKRQMGKTASELREAEKDPTILELQLKKDELSGQISHTKNNVELSQEYIFNLNRDIKEYGERICHYNDNLADAEKVIADLIRGKDDLRAAAEQKYTEHKRTKDAGTIAENYGPRRATLKNQRERKYGDLTALQAKYKDGEFGTGDETIPVYADEYDKLSRHDLIHYEEKLEKAKAECELEFRESFLAKMRENIEQAEDVFKTLNKSLKSIYYGNDAYRFHLSSNKLKQGLYEMITSDVNLGGMTLFSNIFEEKYRPEMDDLFSKLTESDDNGDSVMNEYTDYRSYLDYDIEIISKDGKSQFFSKIYGEKSGGETQTPYYVAIAASFSQMYSLGESIRIIMLDEAFDKMDEDRIETMMQFFRSQNFQIILATPPAKMEIIGEYVDTVLMTYRDGYSSTVEEFEL